ncbi:hypothetical protein QNH39_27775 [Neobacillus novalis]|uniref:Uncharacterized protein n=1 Tax=Neobacillus novalis TaxID=220687 RepID=A0AA95MR05_9BACI|nr:hypothetical protein [Neobacillus novalis]WHY86320.1 hypothetical protein QNH39_27775 [Neobacillus novalis]
MKEDQAKKKKKREIPTAKRTTRFVGDTKMSMENKKALELIRAFRGMYG